jgi:hypothetical protein
LQLTMLVSMWKNSKVVIYKSGDFILSLEVCSGYSDWEFIKVSIIESKWEAKVNMYYICRIGMSQCQDCICNQTLFVGFSESSIVQF